MSYATYFGLTAPFHFLSAGPISSFLVISDPECAKHVLRATDNPSRPVYEKGLVAEVAKFLFGEGFAISGEQPVQQTRSRLGRD